jgi:inosine-uridine nucleoside N-ribohydrolase
MITRWFVGAALIAVPGAFTLWASPLRAEAARPVPLVLDTDIGSDIDDAFALALLLASPEVELRAVTTVGKDTQVRALLTCPFLIMTGRRHVPVAAGAGPQPDRPITGQYPYYYHPDVLFHRTTQPVKESAVELLYAQLKAQPGQVTLLATGPLTNIARLLEERPDCKHWIKRIVLTSGALKSGLDGKPGAVADANIKADVKAARAVFASAVSLVVLPLDAAAGLTLGTLAGVGHDPGANGCPVSNHWANRPSASGSRLVS